MTKEQLGAFVKQQRMIQNMTQQELADKIKCRRQVVIEIENNQCDYGIGIALRVVDALGFKLVPTVSSTELPKYSKKVLYDFKNISPAKEKDDPILQAKKKDRIFAHSNHKKPKV